MQYRGGGLSMMPEVTKNLIIINVLMFLATLLFGNTMYETLGLFSIYGYPGESLFQPYQLVTHMFMHGGFMHIFFNMFALWMFGSQIERALGPKRFFLFYIVTGLGAAALQLGVSYYEIQALYDEGSMQMANKLRGVPMVGASGAVFGLLAAFGMLYPNQMVMLIIPPIPMKAKYFVIIFGAIELFLGFSGQATGIAHFAHVGGALFGVIMILIWRQQGLRI